MEDGMFPQSLSWSQNVGQLKMLLCQFAGDDVLQNVTSIFASIISGRILEDFMISSETQNGTCVN